MNYGKRNDEKTKLKEERVQTKRIGGACFREEKKGFQEESGSEEKTHDHFWRGDCSFTRIADWILRGMADG